MTRIVVFDSGIGGLGVFQVIRRLAPQFHVDFLIDNAAFPYGEKSPDFLNRRITKLIAQIRDKLSPDLIVIACNTASTLILDNLRLRFPSTPFVGCVPPIKWASSISKTRVIGLLATRATVQRDYLKKMHETYARDCNLIVHGSSVLAQLAEQYFRRNILPSHLVKQEIDALLQQPLADKIDVIALGCTHYTFLLDELKLYTPPHICWLDPADAVANQAIHMTTDIPGDLSGDHHYKGKSTVYFTGEIDYENEILMKKLHNMGFISIKSHQSIL